MKKIIIIFSIFLSIIAITDFLNSQTVVRNVFFEGFTSSTCGPCASQNPYMATYLATKGDSIISVKYHMGWPSPGNDPMYLYNTTQNYDRRYYYGFNSIPVTRIDGLYTQLSNYSNYALLNSYFYTRLAVPTPVAMSVVDQRIPGDSIRTTITVTNLSSLPTGNYYLRVMALEKMVKYSSPPGTNGELNFPHVFRRAYPTSQGTVLPTTAGTHTFIITYKIDMNVWVASDIYTIAFVQRDDDKEIMNVAGIWVAPTAIVPISNEIPNEYYLLQNYPNPFNPKTTIEFSIPKSGLTNLTIYNTMGQEIGVYHNGFTNAGKYKLILDASYWSSGVYYYKITSGEFSETKKMLLVK